MSNTSPPDPRIRPIARSRTTLRRADPLEGRNQVSAVEGDLRSVLVELEADIVPASFAQNKWYRIANCVYLVTLRVDELARLADHPDVLLVEAGAPLPASSMATAEEKPVASPAPIATSNARDGAGVIVGIIDDGLDFVLDDFRDTHGRTRVAYLWDQGRIPGREERSPLEFGFGVEYDSAAINRALSAPDPFAVVKHEPKANSHGTHVAGIAVGNGRTFDDTYLAGRHVGIAPQATVVFVHTATVAADSKSIDSYRTGFATTLLLSTAVAYIFEKARQLDLPCVINMSRSLQWGSRDGETLLEHAIDSLLRRRGRALVSTTGNVVHLLGHASGLLRTGEVRRLELVLQDSYSQAVEMWHRSLDRFRIRLVNPAGRATPWIVAGQEFDEPDDGSGTGVLIDYEPFVATNGDASILFELRPAPGGGGVVPGGTWHVDIEALEATEGRFDAWILNLRNSECRFKQTDFDPQCTLAPPSTAFSTIAVGSYDQTASPPVVSAFSARGPTRDGRAKPDLVAPGEKIISSAAKGGVGPRREGAPVRVAETGTSYAAPQVAGAIALMLQAAPGLSTAQIRDLLISGARRAEGVDGFRTDWGHGMLDIERTLALLDEVLVCVPDSGRLRAGGMPGSTSAQPQLASRAVSVEEIAGQAYVETCAGVPIFRLADGRFHVVSNFSVETLEAAREAARKLSSSVG